MTTAGWGFLVALCPGHTFSAELQCMKAPTRNFSTHSQWGQSNSKEKLLMSTALCLPLQFNIIEKGEKKLSKSLIDQKTTDRSKSNSSCWKQEDMGKHKKLNKWEQCHQQQNQRIITKTFHEHFAIRLKCSYSASLRYCIWSNYKYKCSFYTQVAQKVIICLYKHLSKIILLSVCHAVWKIFQNIMEQGAIKASSFFKNYRIT